MKKIILILLSVFSISTCTSEAEVIIADKKDEGKDDTLTVVDNRRFVSAMGVGWNLGNYFDVTDKDKTVWGNPHPTDKMIDFVSDSGFKTLRVPITWGYNISRYPEYKIEEDYFKRIEKVVNRALSNGMYVIINIHHDEALICPTKDRYEKSAVAVEKIWTQVANRFKNADDKLIFEHLNEMRVKGDANEWNGGKKEHREYLNKFHEIALRAIRTSGGNNATRKVMITPYGGSCSPDAIDELVIPKDKNILISLHSYSPYKFAMQGDGHTTRWGSEEDKINMKNDIAGLAAKLKAKGCTIVMGEWGSLHRNNSADRERHAAFFTKCCLENNICPIVWDDGATSNFGLMDRPAEKWHHKGVIDAIIGAYNN